MRLATVRLAERTRAARIEGDELVLLAHADVGALLATGTDWRDHAEADGDTVPLREADLAPPVTRPSKIICLGLNYEPHIREMGRELPAHPTLFAKFASALVGPHDDIVLPPESRQVDWEAELALVIGRHVRRATAEEAVDAIAGYTIMNDISMRDWQWRTTQWLQGKTFDASTPIGPAVVTPDELPGPAGHPDLALSTEVDGQCRQQARTGQLLFGPADVVAYVSTVTSLAPGDVIATGTPGGVGAGRQPQVFLQPGQVVRTAIEGLGVLVNRCCAELS